jgi:hypothetical protein
MAFLSAKFERYGLINQTPSPATRVFVDEVHEDTEASLRRPVTNDTDSDGAGIFAGFRSEVTLASSDVAGVSQIETWMTSFATVEMVAVTPDHVVQWLNPSKILGTEALDITETNLAESQATLVQDGGDQSSHEVYITRNALFPYSVSGAFTQQLIFPVDGVDATLSSDFSTVDGTETITLTAQAGNGTSLDSASVSPSSGGRASVTLPTPSDTHFLEASVSGASPSNPALRVDGSDQYVQR